MSDTADIFETVSETANGLATALPGPAAIVARVVALATKAAAALARNGKKADTEIARILSQEPALEHVREDFERFIRENWPRDRDTEPSPVAPDIYED